VWFYTNNGVYLRVVNTLIINTLILQNVSWTTEAFCILLQYNVYCIIIFITILIFLLQYKV